MVNSEASEQKKLLREEVRAARAKRLEGHHCEDQHDEHVVLFLADNGFRKIAAYVATDDEPCTDLLLGVCEEVGIQVLVPRVSGDELEWVLFDWDRLSEGAFGILEPIGPAELILAEARRHFSEAAARWLTGDSPFTAKLQPRFARYGDYDQLMRLEEWLGRS